MTDPVDESEQGQLRARWQSVATLIAAIDNLRYSRWCDCATCDDLRDMEEAVASVCTAHAVLLPERYRRP